MNKLMRLKNDVKFGFNLITDVPYEKLTLLELESVAERISYALGYDIYTMFNISDQALVIDTLIIKEIIQYSMTNIDPDGDNWQWMDCSNVEVKHIIKRVARNAA